MLEMNNIINLFFGILIRIGIPIVISVIIFYLLRKLDHKWQEEANILPVLTLTGKSCWEVKGCSEEKKEACPAFSQPLVPCWQTFRTKSGVLKDACLECRVFQNTWVTA